MNLEKKILNSEGEELFVETFIPSNIKSTIVFCHGITGCRKGRTKDDNYFRELATKLMELDYKVVLFDFSGHGDSKGNDYDVCLSKSTKELEIVFKEEKVDPSNVSFLAFSYGAAVLCNFLSQNKEVNPNSIVLYSPCIYPLESCFLNPNSIFGKDIVKDYENGSLKEKGYAVVGAKGFRFGMKMIDDCKDFKPTYLNNFSNKILVLSGTNDVILNTLCNDNFCKENNITNIYLEASHSLFEDINVAFKYTTNFLMKIINFKYKTDSKKLE